MERRSFDACLELLADDRRRRVVQQLRVESDTTLEALAESLADDDRERLTTELHHNHLPKMADHGVLEYDPRSGAVLYDPDDSLETLVDAVLSDESLEISS